MDSISEIKNNMIALSTAKKRGETQLSYGDSDIKNTQRVINNSYSLITKLYIYFLFFFVY